MLFGLEFCSWKEHIQSPPSCACTPGTVWVGRGQWSCQSCMCPGAMAEGRPGVSRGLKSLLHAPLSHFYWQSASSKIKVLWGISSQWFRALSLKQCILWAMVATRCSAEASPKHIKGLRADVFTHGSCRKALFHRSPTLFIVRVPVVQWLPYQFLERSSLPTPPNAHHPLPAPATLYHPIWLSWYFHGHIDLCPDCHVSVPSPVECRRSAQRAGSFVLYWYR